LIVCKQVIWLKGSANPAAPSPSSSAYTELLPSQPHLRYFIVVSGKSASTFIQSSPHHHSISHQHSSSFLCIISPVQQIGKKEYSPPPQSAIYRKANNPLLPTASFCSDNIKEKTPGPRMAAATEQTVFLSAFSVASALSLLNQLSAMSLLFLKGSTGIPHPKFSLFS
jgi:hypothetical protein